MTEKMVSQAVEILDRVEKEKENLASTELVLDESNEVAFPGYPYFFEAMLKKIIVSIDIYKSGYECKVCKGRKRIEIKCSCEEGEHLGLRYAESEIKTIRDTLGDEIAKSRAALPCPECKGDYIQARKTVSCTACKGLGAILILPETSKNLPTTGVVVSIGHGVKRNKIKYKIGDRVMFGPYTGAMIPTRAGLLFKILDWNAVWCKVRGADELGAFDFILNENSD